MKAIITRYHGPTDTRGSRVTASDMDGNRVTVPYDHSLNATGMHKRAAVALVRKMGWDRDHGMRHGSRGLTLRGGATRDGYAWVMDDSELVYVQSLRID